MSLTLAEQERRDLAQKSQGLLKEEWLHGSLWILSLGGNLDVTVSVVSGVRPYKVTWKTSGDRKIRGEYKSVEFYRSRSFAKISSMLKFLEGLV